MPPQERGLPKTAWLLLFLLFLSAFSLVYVKDVHRRLLRDYQVLQQKSLVVRTEWEKLLLERSAWMSQSRIIQIAQDNCHMHAPSAKETRLWHFPMSNQQQDP